MTTSALIVQNSWLTVVVKYSASNKGYSISVNGAVVNTGTIVTTITDRTLTHNWIVRSNNGEPYLNADIAGAFVSKTQDYSFFETPCAARWAEYFFTSPCQVVLIATCLMLRDVYTILLLSAAQAALVQFGFAMECAYEMRSSETINKESSRAGDPDSEAVAFRPLPMVPLLITTPKLSQQLWYWSFVPATFLHIVIWGVLFTAFVEQKPCSPSDGEMPKFVVFR